MAMDEPHAVDFRQSQRQLHARLEQFRRRVVIRTAADILQSLFAGAIRDDIWFGGVEVRGTEF